MKFIPGGVAAGGAISGKSGGIVASHNRYGYYFRPRTIPVNPNTAQQQAVRNQFQTLASRWFTVLTPTQRADWETYSANVPTTDRLGLTIHPTGQNWYIACNTLRKSAALDYVDDAPGDFTLMEFTPPTLTASEATQLASMAFTDTDAWANETGGGLLCFLSRPANSTINFFAGPYRWAGVAYGDDALPPVTPQTMAVPFPVTENQKLFYRINAVGADGRIGAPVRGSLIVAA